MESIARIFLEVLEITFLRGMDPPGFYVVPEGKGSLALNIPELLGVDLQKMLYVLGLESWYDMNSYVYLIIATGQEIEFLHHI